MTTPIPAELAPLMTDSFPPQRKFSYRREAWSHWLSEIPGAAEAIRTFPDMLDRPAVAQIFTSMWPGNIAGAFVGVMIWGYGSDNRGPSRTLAILTQQTNPRGAQVDPLVVDRLRTSVETVRSAGPREAYAYLNNAPGKISGLGPSFFTKWLYFASVSGPAGVAGAAPILDKLVINWLANLEPGIEIQYARTPDYSRYVELLTGWGEPFGLGPAEVEERVFRLLRNDGAVRAGAGVDDQSQL